MIAFIDLTALVALLPAEKVAVILQDGVWSALYSEREAAKYLHMDINVFRGLGLPVTSMHDRQRRMWSRATLDKAISARTEAR